MTTIKRVLFIPTDWPHFLSYTSASSTVSLRQSCPYLGYNIAHVASFCTVAPNICEYSAWDMFHSTLLTHKILRYLPDFENLHTPGLSHTVPNTAKQMKADSHYMSRFCSVTVPSSFRQTGLCSHCRSCSVTFRHGT
jgi:hypothetical protein